MHAHATLLCRIDQVVLRRCRDPAKPHHQVEPAGSPLHLDLIAKMAVQRVHQRALPRLLQAAYTPHMPVVAAVFQQPGQGSLHAGRRMPVGERPQLSR